MTTTVRAAELPEWCGRDLPPSSWLEIDQQRVDLFAEATNDHQYIHVDPERAAQSPFGGTIAHGFLTLSLLSHLVHEHFIRVEGTRMALNYGFDSVRFIHPVRVGSRVRSQQTLIEATEKAPGRWLLKTRVSVEIENVEKPALSAVFLTMIITT